MAVTIKQVDYYGYVVRVSYDIRDLTVRVEFIPGDIRNFDLGDIRPVEFPKDKP